LSQYFLGLGGLNVVREVETAIGEAEQMNERLLRTFARVPDDRLTWAPSATARSAVELMAHCGFSLGFICELLGGTPYPAPTTAQADAEHLERERAVRTREEALSLWNSNHAKYVALIGAMAEEDMGRMVTLPFGLGAAPMSYMVGVGPLHTREHVAQLEYLQTIYGDREW
jgi:hypothetical protein